MVSKRSRKPISYTIHPSRLSEVSPKVAFEHMTSFGLVDNVCGNTRSWLRIHLINHVIFSTLLSISTYVFRLSVRVSALFNVFFYTFHVFFVGQNPARKWTPRYLICTRLCSSIKSDCRYCFSCCLICCQEGMHHSVCALLGFMRDPVSSHHWDIFCSCR